MKSDGVSTTLVDPPSHGSLWRYTTRPLPIDGEPIRGNGRAGVGAVQLLQLAARKLLVFLCNLPYQFLPTEPSISAISKIISYTSRICDYPGQIGGQMQEVS
jgi:hypothetical protein